VARKRLTRQESREQTVDLLIDAASKVFFQKGYAATSVEDVASEAGFSTGAVYANFSGKAALFAAANARRQDGHTTRLPGVGAGTSQTALLRSLMLWDLRRREQDRTQLLLNGEFLLSSAALDPKLAPAIRQDYERNYERVSGMVTEARDRFGTHPSMDDRDIAIALQALSDGLDVIGWYDPEAVPVPLFAKVFGVLTGLSSNVVRRFAHGEEPVGADLGAPPDHREAGLADVVRHDRTPSRKTLEVTIPALVEAAYDAFRSDGYAASTLEQVAASAGFSKSVVYSNFGSKESLFWAVVLAERPLATDRLLDRVRDAGTADALVRGLASISAAARRTTFDFFLRNAEFWLAAARREPLAAKVRSAAECHRIDLGVVIRRTAPQGRRALTDDEIATAIVSIDMGFDAHVALGPRRLRRTIAAEAVSILLEPMREARP